MYRELMKANQFYISRYNFSFQKLAFLKPKITRSDVSFISRIFEMEI